MITEKILYKNDSGDPIEGLTPTVSYLIRVSDGVSITPVPEISEIGHGWYQFNFDNDNSEDYVFCVDCGVVAGITDRYVEGVIPKTLTVEAIQFGLATSLEISELNNFSVEEIQSGLATSLEIAALNDISVSDIFNAETEEGLTLRHAMQIITALALKAAGGGTSIISFRNYEDSKNRLTMTVDENGNRTDVTVDLD